MSSIIKFLRVLMQGVYWLENNCLFPPNTLFGNKKKQRLIWKIRKILRKFLSGFLQVVLPLETGRHML